MRPKKFDKIPEAFSGKGPRGYLLYDMVHHRTNRAPQVTQDFKDIVRRRGTSEENRTKSRLLERMKIGGPRFATMSKKK